MFVIIHSILLSFGLLCYVYGPTLTFGCFVAKILLYLISFCNFCYCDFCMALYARIFFRLSATIVKTAHI
jgi:hypothetical protein